MIFKRFFCIFSVLALTITLFTGCASSNTLKDGTYRAEAKDFDSSGYKDYVVVTIKDAKYSSVEFDSFYKDDTNKKKSQDEVYAAAYPSGKNYVKPAKYSKQLAEKLLSDQNIQKVDVIATATTSSNSFKKLISALESNIKKGKTDTLVVDKAS
jgi:major membrane immunogen (membrane-anchored lipoprotein)